METAKALIKYIRISPFKVRRISNEIINKRVPDVEAYLSVMTNKGALAIKKAVHSARTSYMAKNKDTDELDLIVSKILINQGPMLKRFHPIGRGRVGRILKRSCHIYVEVSKKEGAK